MRILFLSDNFIPETNAAANRVYERACYWVKWGHQVTVLTSAPNKPEGRVYPGYKNAWISRENINGIEVIRVKTFITKNEGFALRMIDFLSYMVMACVVGIFLPKADVVCATSPQFFTAVSGWFVAKVHRRPFVFEVSDLWPGAVSSLGVVRMKAFLRLAETLELFLYAQAARIVALTHAFRENMVERGVLRGKIDVIQNGVDLPRLKYLPRDPELTKKLGLQGKFVVGYLGTHGLAQGLPHVVELLAHPTLVANPRLHFLFVGQGVERPQVIERAQALGLRNITFVESQPKSEIPKLWSVVDLALVSLKDDPIFCQFLPSKMFEAMGAGKPILLICPEGEAHGIVRQTQSGWCLEPHESEKFVNALNEACNNESIYWHHQSQSQASAVNFSRETQARLFINTLNSCVERTSTADADAGSNVGPVKKSL